MTTGAEGSNRGEKRVRDTNSTRRHTGKQPVKRNLTLQAEHYFGTLQKAIAQSKKDLRVARVLSKPKILALLSQMHRCGLCMNHKRGENVLL